MVRKNGIGFYKKPSTILKKAGKVEINGKEIIIWKNDIKKSLNFLLKNFHNYEICHILKISNITLKKMLIAYNVIKLK